MAVLDYLPAATALVGGYAGVRWALRGRIEDELRVITDEAIEGLELAEQRRERAQVLFNRELAKTSGEGWDAINAFKDQIRELAKVRGRLLVRVKLRDRASIHLVNAVLALGRCLDEFEKAGYWNAEHADRFKADEAARALKAAHADFEQQRLFFIEASSHRNLPRWSRERLRRRRTSE